MTKCAEKGDMAEWLYFDYYSIHRLFSFSKKKRERDFDRMNFDIKFKDDDFVSLKNKE